MVMVNNFLENKNKVKNYFSDFNELEKSLTVKNLSDNSNVLYEAMVLNFLIDPIKPPVQPLIL